MKIVHTPAPCNMCLGSDPLQQKHTHLADVEEEEISVQMGFGASSGNPDPFGKHKHEYRICDGASPYYKNFDARVGYIMLFCNCGDTKEVIAEDRR